MCLRPQHISDSDSFLEESAAPHAHEDHSGEDEEIVLGAAEVKKLDKTLRITMKDLQQFGFTDRCPRCSDLQKGVFRAHECTTRIAGCAFTWRTRTMIIRNGRQ